MFVRFFTLSILFSGLFLAGCITPPAPNSEFSKTVNFSSLDKFSYKHTLVTGLEFRASEKLFLEDLSEKTIVEELNSRGFTPGGEDSDFYVVTKWKKAVSSYPSRFNHIDGYGDTFARRNEPAYAFSSRIHLTLEIYERSSGNLFWRNDLPNIFDAIQLTEGRVVAALRRAIKNFPEHIEKDPNLPSIE